jgi:hypothetical protein
MDTTMIRAGLLSIALSLALLNTAHADVEVNARQDSITLNDGTEIQCLILMMAPSGVIIVENDPKDPAKKTQRTILRRTIRNIVIGERTARTEALFTDFEFAHKVVVGTAKKDEAGDKLASTKEDAPKRATSSKKPGSKKKELPGAEKDAPEKDAAKAETAPQGAKPPAPETVVPVAPVTLPPESLPPKELIDIYLNRFPGLQASAMDVVSPERVQEWLASANAGNPNARQPLEALLNVYLGNATDVPRSGMPVNGAVPSRSGRYALPPVTK